MADLQSTNSDYNRLGAEELVGLFLQKHRKACITCSFQAEGMVVLDFARKIEPDIPVLFLETGYHFPETYAYRDRMAAEWRLNLVNLVADSSVAEQEAAHRKLYQTAPDRCCHLRKVEPLLRGLHPYDTWFTGLRREQSPTRANLAAVEQHALPGGKTITKVSPLAFWSWKQVWNYLGERQIPVLPLYELGYSSIGCQPCTGLPLDPGDARSGRWAGRKLECGIHTFGQSK